MHRLNPRDTPQSVRRGLCLLVLGVLAPATTFLGQKSLQPYTIFVSGKTVHLIVLGRDCENSGGFTSQLLVSTDGGRSWQKSGPEMDGSEFDFLSEKEGKVWIAGYHTLEGPEAEPFVFIPTESPTRWKMRTIYRGNGGLKRIAWGSKGELNAWIPHLRLDDEWKGPTYIHQSWDGGLTWKVLGGARKLNIKKRLEFTELDNLKNPLWRIANFRDREPIVQIRESRVQYRETEKAPWKTVSRFVNHPCHFASTAPN